MLDVEGWQKGEHPVGGWSIGLSGAGDRWIGLGNFALRSFA
jgi:hypothetical protein